MMLNADCKPFGIGSLPYKTGLEAWMKVLENFSNIPFWPQLTQRSYLENMYVQFSEGLPGVVVDTTKQRVFIKINQEQQQDTEQFYIDFLSEDLEKFKVSRDYCEGIYTGFDLIDDKPDLFADCEFIKGQITGPVSFGIQLIDEDQKPILYNDLLHDIEVKNIQRKAKWQEETLKKLKPNTIISVDEPYLSSMGSGFINLKREQVIEDIESVFTELNGLKAMHCCGNTDWSIITETSLDILLFDAFDYMNNVILFAQDIKTFFESGGILGWGIVPTTPNALESVNIKSLTDQLELGFKSLSEKGIDHDQLVHQSLITPSCGLGNLTIGQAERAMKYTNTISEYIRVKYELK